MVLLLHLGAREIDQVQAHGVGGHHSPLAVRFHLPLSPLVTSGGAVVGARTEEVADGRSYYLFLVSAITLLAALLGN